MENDTIFALSSGAGKAGVAVFRLSGSDALKVLNDLVGYEVGARTVHYAKLFAPGTKELIDSGIVFCFRAPASFTGEDMAELQVHGSIAVIDALSEILCAQGLRPAEPGEFTLRAFENGKIDLAQAEALADLIDAETTLQKQQALQQADGRLSAVAADWNMRLLQSLAPLEAGIDFPDEEDVPAEIESNAVPVINAFISELSDYLEVSSQAKRVREGISIVLLGRPNAGKSSLLNYLANSEVAIVSDTPGTTRDLVTVRLDIEGVPVTIIDTAGLREVTHDTIELEGMRRARERAGQADIRLLLVDGSHTSQELHQLTRELLTGDAVIYTKRDLEDPVPDLMVDGVEPLSASVVTGQGMMELRQFLSRRIVELCGDVEEPRLTRLRHVHAVQNAREALIRSLERINMHPELAAEDVRLAMRHLGSITGKVDVEDILGEIFSSFCIGK
ncbi:MAG: tRNA uridine-5-carboxymethylaminomethyl(34) synthesis GTPase MnmE [Aquisalinus sp.]|nr:tRNA uridine-5-carboxymethylaminomethyl(34) synthesis GTPase MnmE [Aquisalinus sp.]